MSATTEVESPVAQPVSRGRRSNPWRQPYFLAAVTIGYLIWSLVPVLIAIMFSFNAGRSRSVWQGFSLRWYDTDPYLSVVNDPTLRNAMIHTVLLAILTVLVAVPLGIAFALGLDRWRGRIPQGANLMMILAFVIPEIVLAVGLLFLVRNLATPFTEGTVAQVVGLVTFQLSYPVVICRARLLTIGPQYEQAARDLGASQFEAVRRVLLPMLAPAVFASAVLVFADVIDNFIIVRYLSIDAGTETAAMRIYNTARGAPSPALNAMATIMLLLSLLVLVLGWLAYRFFNRRSGEKTSISDFANQG